MRYIEILIIAAIFAAAGVNYAVSHFELTTPLGAIAGVCAGALGGFWVFLVSLVLTKISRDMHGGKS